MNTKANLKTTMGIRTTCILAAFLFVFGLSLNGQSGRIDSLKQLAISTSFPDRLEHIFTWYIETNELFHEPEMVIVSEAINWLESKPLLSGEEQLQLGRLKVMLGYMYADNEQLADLHREAAEVVVMAETIGQNADSWMLFKGKAYFQLYLVCYLEERQKEGIPFLDKSYRCFEQIDDLSGMAQVQNSLGSLYNGLEDYPKALNYSEKAAALYEEAGNERGAIRARFYQSTAYIEMGNMEEAERLLRDLIPRMEETEHPSLNIAMANLGDVQASLERYEAAETNLLKSLEMAKKRRVNFTVAETYQFLANMEEKRGDFGKALFYQRQQVIYADSIRIQAMDKGLQEAQAKFDQTENELRIRALEQKIVQEKRASLLKMLLLAFGLLAIGGGIYWFFHEKKKKEVKAAARVLTVNLQEKPAQKEESTDTFLEEFLQIVQSEVANEELSVESIAQTMHMSRVQLFKKVKKATDASPSQIIRQYRLETGKKLLLENKLSISEIAYRVGFSNPNSFGRAFKGRFGTSPSAFLNKNKDI